MMKFPENLNIKLQTRIKNNAFRSLRPPTQGIDFASNDYLGFAKNESIFEQTQQYLKHNNLKQNGATGSRLLTGNHFVYQETETFVADFHLSESALIFNSGYDANVGFFGSLPQRQDIILYDELCHASIREGILLSNAKSYKFIHNDLEDLETKIIGLKMVANLLTTNFYIATESVFSMDGDSPNLEKMCEIATNHNCLLVVDEAHALGVFGNNGEGLVQYLGLQDQVFARIMTFGKALGCHGAAILCCQDLKDYLINFSKNFIYTTALPPCTVATILIAYQTLNNSKNEMEGLKNNIVLFNQQKVLMQLNPLFVYSKSAIQSAIIQGNENVKKIANVLQNKGFEVKPILSPTVPEGQERLRFCLHNYNAESQIIAVLETLQSFF